MGCYKWYQSQISRSVSVRTVGTQAARKKKPKDDNIY